MSRPRKTKIPSDCRKVYGPYEKGDKWQVPWDDVQGNRHSPSFKALSEATEFRDGCAKIEAAFHEVRKIGIEFREPDGTITWWADLIARLAYDMVTSNDLSKADHLGELLTKTGSASKAMKTFIDNSAIEKRIETLEQHDKEIARQKRSTRVSGTRGKVLPIRDSTQSGQ